MAAKQSAATERALALIIAGTHTAYSAARAERIAPSTIYRALAKIRQRNESIRECTELDADQYSAGGDE